MAMLNNQGVIFHIWYPSHSMKYNTLKWGASWSYELSGTQPNDSG